MRKVSRPVNRHQKYLRNSVSDMISVLLLLIIMYFAFS
jgi:hypothetical protein